MWTSFAGQVPTLTSGRADMGVALYRTPEREKVVDFTIPYKWVGDHVIVHADDKTTTSLETFRGKVLGNLRGTAHDVAARKLQEAGYLRDIRVYETVDAMYQDLNVRRVDGIINSALFHQWIQSQNPGLRARLAFEIDPIYFGRTSRSASQFPVYKGATKVAEAANKIILELRENGELARIFGRYGITEPSVWTPPQ